MISKIKLSNYILRDMSEESRNNLINRYEKLFQSFNSNAEDKSYILNNIDNYKILLNVTVFVSAMQFIQSNKMADLDYCRKEITAKSAENSGNSFKAFKALHSKYVDKLSALCNINDKNLFKTCIDIESVEQALNTFDLQTVSVDDIPDTDFDMQGDFGDLDDVMSELFPDEEENTLDFEEEPDDLDWTDFQEPDDILETDINMEEDLDDTEEDIKEIIDAIEKEEEYEKKRLEEEEENRKALENGKVSGEAQKLENEDTEAREEALQGLIDQTIREIMNTYSKLYAPLFLNPPKGVFFTDEHGNKNILAIGNEESGTGVKVHSLNRLMYMTGPMYQAILNGTNGLIKEAPKVGDDGMSIDANWMNPDGTMKYNYAPHIQVRNCSGVFRDDTGKLKRAKTWGEFQPKLQKTLKPTITALFNRVTDSSNHIRASKEIKEFYTSVFMLNEFDASKSFRLTCYNTTLEMNGLINKIVNIIIAADPLNIQTNYKVMNNENIEGVQQSLVVTDMKRYKGELNFAYKTLSKILETGGKISLSDVVVGTDLKGEPLTVNLKASNLISLGVIAGSGSGKGVLTLSLMASMLAAGSPIVYLDYKPDMAGMLWDLERKVPGSRILAIDGQMGRTETSSPTRAYTAGFGAPAKVFEEIGSNLKVLPYVKGVQLMNLVAKARVMGKIPKGTKMFFILDEAQVCNVAIDNSRNSIEAMVKANKPKGKDTPSEEYNYLLRLQKLFNINECVQAFLNTNGRVGNTTCVVLGQQADAANWKMPLGLLVKQCTSKFLGKGTKGGSVYGLSEKTQGSELLGMGYFGYSDSNRPDENNTKMLKTTMVLNEADFDVNSRTGGPFTGSLLNNVTDPDLHNYVIDNDMIVSEDNTAAQSMGIQIGEANPLVGFPGLVQYMASKDSSFNMAERLSAGYNMCEKVLNLLGLVGEGCPYENIEAYLHSGKEDSLFTDQELSSALDCGKTIFDYKETGLDLNEDGKLNTEPSLIDMAASDNQISNIVENITEQDFNTESTPVSSNQTTVELRFMSTKQLISANYDDNTLSNYMNKHIYNRLSYNKVENLDYKNVNNSVGGLLTMTILAGTLHYVSSRGLYNIQKFRAEAEQYIYSGMDNSHAYKVLLGLLDCYDQGIVDYDKKVTSDRIKGFILKYFNSVNTNNTESQGFDTQGYESNIDFGTSETVVFGNEEESGAMNINGQSPILNSQSIPEDSMPIPGIHRVNDQGEMIVDNPRSTTEIITRDASTYVEVPLSQYGFAKKMQKKFFESKNGIAYEFKLRWDFILGIIGKTFPDSSRVHTLVLRDNSIRVNPSNDYPGTEVIANGTLGGDYNIQLSDIVSFKDTFKKLPMLRKIEIDSSIIPCAIREYGEEAQITMFEKHRNLLVIVMGDQTYNRNTLEQQKQQMKEQMSVEKTKMAIEATCASKNPRLNKKSPGYVSKVFDFGHNVTGNVTSGGWGATKNFARKAKESATRKNPSIGGMLGWSLGATALLGFTAIFAIPHGIGSAIKGISDSFKG